MNKYEFLDSLRAFLTGRVNEMVISDNIRYYENYINMEIRSGYSETEIMELLGDPRLIARSIIEAEKAQDQSERAAYGTGYTNDDGGFHENGTTYKKNSFWEKIGFSKSGFTGGSLKSRMMLWLTAGIIIAVVVLIIVAFVYLLWWLMPVLLVCACVTAIYKFLE
ncbi:MAG: DUF1700 domain-containing protein [Lachnospiraceae bacterium]|nr:DUF1700 domain-containing protein [Lachnospiraceae bacterium]